MPAEIIQARSAPETERRVIVVGAGAGGMMAAGRAAELGAHVLLLEKTERPGKKLLISGKRRCNLSNAKPLDDFLAMYGANGRFLRSAFGHFFRDELLALLRRYGVETTTETDGRIFPSSNDAHDVVEALQHYCEDHGVELRTGIKVRAIQVQEGRVTGVQTEREVLPATGAVLATGGASYPGTGSQGDVVLNIGDLLPEVK